MRSFASCLTIATIALVGVFFYFAAFGGVRQSSQVAVLFTPTSVWASFPPSAVTPYVTDAIYQPFQRGFMLWRADYDCVYAIETNLPSSKRNAIIPLAVPLEGDSGMIRSYGYCLSVAPLIPPTVAPLPLMTLAPPTGLLEPTGALAKVYHAYDAIQSGLGYATAPEQRYTATVPTNEGAAVMDGSPFTIAQITLPDGTILACGSRAATAGTC